MKNKPAVILAILLLISVAFNVYFVSQNLGNSSSDFCGEYYCNDWNGGQATLIINEDGTGQYPGGGSMTWTYTNDQLILTTGSGEHLATPTENGLILHDTPFFKM